MLPQVLVIIASVCVVVWGIIGLSCYYAGYVPRHEENANLVQTNGLIIRQIIKTQLCEYDCNCVKVCTMNNKGVKTCVTSCATCSYTCYDHSIVIQFTPETGTTLITGPQTATVYLYNSRDSGWNSDYAVGKVLTCYYNICNLAPTLAKYKDSCLTNSNGATLVLSKYNDRPFYQATIASIVLVGIFGSVCTLLVLALGAIACWARIKQRLVRGNYNFGHSDLPTAGPNPD